MMRSMANDKVRRVLQVQGVGLELAQSGVQVLVLAFVFPAEAAAPPDVRPAVAAADFLRAALETVALAEGIVRCGRRLAQERAQIEKVFLRTLTLTKLAVAPLANECGG